MKNFRGNSLKSMINSIQTKANLNLHFALLGLGLERIEKHKPSLPFLVQHPIFCNQQPEDSQQQRDRKKSKQT